MNGLAFYTIKIGIVVLLVLFSCDPFKEDGPPPPEINESARNYYILPGTTTVIDLKAMVSSSLNNLVLTVSGEPSKGKLTRLTEFLLKYDPDKSFTTGNDEIKISISSNGKLLKTETLIVKMFNDKSEFPCMLMAVEDRVKVNPDNSVSVKMLGNDNLCGFNRSELQINIHFQPKFGEAVMTGDSIITYTPNSLFMNHDEIVYRIMDAQTKSYSYGILRITDKTEIKILYLPPGSGNDVFFTDELIGFVGGRNAIYKTVDGGENWQRLAIEMPGELITISDVFFPDTQNGYVIYSSEKGNGLMSTSDGGNSWEKLQLDYDLRLNSSPFTLKNAMYFTSKAKGFLCAYGYERDSTTLIGKILKTEDSGQTWKEVFSVSEGLFFHIIFTTDLMGFASLLLGERDDHNGNQYRRKILATKDGGETWTVLADGSDHLFNTASPENVVYGTTEYDNKIVRTQDGAAWQTVAQFPYDIWYIGFSPSGTVGYVLGASFTPADPMEAFLTINRSNNKGETWGKEELETSIAGFPWSWSIPSNNVAYILCYNHGYNPFIVKHYRP